MGAFGGVDGKLNFTNVLKGGVGGGLALTKVLKKAGIFVV